MEPKSYWANDISKKEVSFAKKLLKEKESKVTIKWIIENLNEIKLDKQFDIIIGNSFLHHMPNVPEALKNIYKMLKPGGSFITLHEPTPLSVLETRKWYTYPWGFIP